ncbi:hypothetical protein [Ideonella paludis]|uniref:DUF4136 domain-containing protein n=1 Tax=Ideonella paludis TaxID=1233411 RepID=A0ABS5E2W5_9BURK|nr:hypothetical protein [Ideonella paludis]MBQ0937755.1 hypothetical protein [Ideonella paludis]
MACLLTGCVAPPQRPTLKPDSLAVLQGNTLSTEVRPANFSLSTGGATAATLIGALFLNADLVIAAAESAAQQAGAPLAKEVGLTDPAYTVATELATRLGRSAGAKVQSLAKPEDGSELGAPPPSRFVLEARTDRWAAQYLALDKGRYGTQLALTVSLSDSQTGSMVATAQCQRIDAESDRIAGYDALIADGAARLHQAMDKHTQACITEMWGQLSEGLPLNIGAPVAVSEPVVAALAPAPKAAVDLPDASPAPAKAPEPPRPAAPPVLVSVAPASTAPVPDVAQQSRTATQKATAEAIERKSDSLPPKPILPVAAVNAAPPPPTPSAPAPAILPAPQTSAADAGRGPMIVLPPRTAADRVLENSQIAHRYHIYLSRPNPKAFAVSANGGWWMAWGEGPGVQGTVSQRAVRGCEERSNSTCVLYAVDDRVVFGLTQKERP